MKRVEDTIISQYGNSPTLLQLIRDMDQYLDPTADLDAFYSFVWDVETARGFGLDIWGRIVGIGRTLLIAPPVDYFGFNEAAGSAHSFGEAPFYNGVPPISETYILQDDAYRKLILTKALANISATNAAALNQLLQNMFAGRGRCYVNDLGGMGLRYVFEFSLTQYEYAIMTQSGALPRPAGVDATLFQSPLPLFGFSEAGASAAPFGEGVFIPEGTINAAL